MNKFCKRCNNDKNCDLFYNDRSKLDGKATICKECKNKSIASYQEKIKDPKYVSRAQKHALEATTEQKLCGKCKNIKPYDDFQKQKSSRDGLQHYCKMCNAEIQKMWRNNNGAKRRLTYNIWRNKNKTRVNELAAIATKKRRLLTPSKFKLKEFNARARKMNQMV